MALSIAEQTELLELLESQRRQDARDRHIDFIDYCWQKAPTDPFLQGFHTKRICAAIDDAIQNFRRGISTYLLINVHYRSGKTDMVSRYLAPHFLGEFPSQEVIQTSYQADLAARFASDARKVFRSDQFSALYPKIELSGESNAKGYWEIVRRRDGKPTGGKMLATGLMHGLTGNGYGLGIVDDFCGSRRDAESLTMRNNTYTALTDDFLTRAAPVHITLITATPWHWDDAVGRIKAAMKKDPSFPQFLQLSFPARASDYTGPGNYPGKYLFPERYPDSWYEQQRATLGKYAAAGLLDCNPIQRGDALLNCDYIEWADPKRMPSKTQLKWARVWDLAHTKQERSGDDPDWTSGTLLAFEQRPNDRVPFLYIAHVARTREAAGKRDAFIRQHAAKDGQFVRQVVESSLDSKDAFHYLREAMPEISWNRIGLSGDKQVRATPLEPIFEAPGHVIVARGDWNDAWLDEVLRFDGSGDMHDDQVDNLSSGHAYLVSGRRMRDNGDTAREMAERRGRR